MKVFIQLFSLIYLISFTQSLKDGGSYYYTVDEFFSFFNTQKFTEQEYEEILGNLSKIFENSYAFNDISKNPPQPSENYHSVLDIQDQFKQIKIKDIENVYDFYRKISIALSSLKDPHIRIFFNDYYFNYFFLLGPFDYFIKEYQGEQRIFADCLSTNILEYFEFESEFLSNI